MPANSHFKEDSLTSIANRKLKSSTLENLIDISEDEASFLAYIFPFVPAAVFLSIETLNKKIMFHSYQSLCFWGCALLYWIVYLQIPNGLFKTLLAHILTPTVFLMWIYIMWMVHKKEAMVLPYFGRHIIKMLESRF